MDGMKNNMLVQELNNKSLRKSDIAFLILMVLGATLLIWKAPFGIVSIDEPFYLTLSHRLVKGDALLSEEWQVSQLFSFLVYPIMKLYYYIFASTEGILLHFRYIFLCLHIFSSVILYIMLRKKYSIGAMIAVIYYFLYIPYLLMSLIHTTIGNTMILFTLLAFALMRKKSKIGMMVIGAVYASSVLAVPHFALLYFLYSAYVIVNKYRKNQKDDIIQFQISTWIWFSCGVFLIAILFWGFVLSRASLSEVAVNIGHILKDPLHSKGIIYKVGTYFIFTAYIFHVFGLLWIACFFAWLFDKKKEQHEKRYVIINIIIFISCMIYKMTDIYNEQNMIMTPIIMLGIVSYIYLKNKDKYLFYFVYIGGIILSFLEHLSTSGLMDSISRGLVISGVASIIFIFQYIQQKLTQKPFGKIGIEIILLSVALSIQIGAECYAQIHSANWTE